METVILVQNKNIQNHKASNQLFFFFFIIDCIKFVNENQVLSKSTNGRLEYWNLETEKTIRSIKIRTGENSSRFDISLDGLFVCVGSSAGVIFIYNLQTGKMVTELGHKKSTRPIRCCMFTRDCR
jgi:WD40 repeat protein